MDYHSVHGHDISSFDAPGTHRLPTISASQALEDLTKETSSCLSTGLGPLDQVLSGGLSTSQSQGLRNGGVKRGQITEIWGPPGDGRTALGVQLAALALKDGGSVVWVDCFQQVSVDRISQYFEAARRSPDKEGEGEEASNLNLNLYHYSCLTLPHLMALISRPHTISSSSRISLVVISDLSALINSALPRPVDPKQARYKANQGPTSTSKRLQALQSIIGSLQKLAAARNCAVVLLSQSATKMQGGQGGATLIPAINASVWENGISTRIVVFGDWIWTDRQPRSLSVAMVEKLDAKPVYDEHAENACAFEVSNVGIGSVEYNTEGGSTFASGHRYKRKLGQTELEIPGSDEEDYGWADEDEGYLPPPPSQWQGSEDIILGAEENRTSDEEQEDAEADGEEESRNDDEAVGKD